MNSLSIQKLKIGDSSEIKKIFLERDVMNFAELTTDKNPTHIDKEYAATSMFKKQIVHGMFVASLFSAIFGVQMPGLGSIYIKQSLKFTKPVYFGDEISAKVIVKELKYDRNRVVFDCIAFNQNDETVIIGEAEIMPPKEEAL